MNLDDLNLSHGQFLTLLRAGLQGALDTAAENCADATAPRDVRANWKRRLGELVAVMEAFRAVSPLVPPRAEPTALTEIGL